MKTLGPWLLTILLMLHSTAPRAVCGTRCVCGGGYSARWVNVDAPVVFVGSVIDVHRNEPRRVDGFTFVVERSWKGVSTDTVDVHYGRGFCGSEYQLGGTYLVLADSSGPALIVPRCSDAIWIQRAQKHLKVLGRPTWRARPIGERTIDKLVRETIAQQGDTSAESYPYNGTRIIVRDRFWRNFEGVRIDLRGTGIIAITDSTGTAYLRRLRLGWYVARLTFPDGMTEDHYIRLRCAGWVRAGKACLMDATTVIPTRYL